MIDTSSWTTRCAGCGFTRPFNEAKQGDHDCPNPATLDTALEMLMKGADR